MPKKTNVLPNLRIDLPDYKAQTADFTQDSLKQQLDEFIADNFASIADGFRVEIADQGATPGLFTIVNGLAFDRSGQIVTNEDERNAARSNTLIADATYFVEVEFLLNDSDVDARGFWDPTFDNGNDPSGDTRPTGREFSQSVATRLSPDWQIVTPISTTDFDLNTDPNSVKIPIAVLTVSGGGGVITGGTTAPLSSVIAESILLGATSVQLLNTREMPDSFTLTLDPGGAGDEDVAVTVNDRANGILTISATAGGHAEGIRVVVAGATPPEYLVERTSGTLPTSGTEDARPRFFQADEERGNVIWLDPTGTGTDRSDASVTSLKRHVDFLAAQLRELKFGSALDVGVGAAAPPSSFNSVPRYFDQAGSVSGARCNTVSVGDGVASFGDFNVLQSGSAQAAIQAAIDACPSLGGTLYIKHGTYDIGATPISISKPITIVGDGIQETLIRATDVGGSEAITSTSPDDFNMSNLSLLVDTAGGATASHAIVGAGGDGSNWENLEVWGVDCSAATADLMMITNCDFHAPSTGGAAILGEFFRCAFYRCTFQANAVGAAGRNANLTFSLGGFAYQALSFADCLFHIVTGQDGIDLDGQIEGLTFERCQTTKSGTTGAFISTPGGDTDIRILHCHLTNDGGIGDLSSADGVLIDGCKVEFAADEVGVKFTNGDKIIITNCTFSQLTSGTIGFGVIYDNSDNLTVSNCTFIGCDTGLEFQNDVNNVHVNRCKFDGNTTAFAGVSFSGVGLLGNGSITNCTFQDITKTAVDCVGIGFNPGSGLVQRMKIENCDFSSIGSNTSTNAWGVIFDLGANVATDVVIDRCTFDIIHATTVANGVRAQDSTSFKVLNSRFSGIGNNAAGPEWQAIRCDDNQNSLSIEGNTMDVLGSTGSGNAIQVGAATTGNIARMISICRNHISTIGGGGTRRGISVAANAENITLTGNHMLLDNSSEFGIFLESTVAGSPYISNVVVNGNTISGVHDTGICVAMADSTANVEGRCAVMGNIVRDCGVAGIHVEGAASENVTHSIAVAGNVVESSLTSVIGINAIRVSAFSIGNNTVLLTSVTGAHTGINLDGCNEGTVVGNHVEHNATTGNGIDSTTGATSNMSASGNYVRLSNGSNTGTCMDLGNGPNCISAGNMLSNANSGGGGFAYADNGTDDFGRAYRNVENNAGVNPTTSTICLNRRN